LGELEISPEHHEGQQETAEILKIRGSDNLREVRDRARSASCDGERQRHTRPPHMNNNNP
jgi:hypothetical protein